MSHRGFMRDVFGNRCRRFRSAPSGDLTISNAGVIEVSGLPDPVAADAAEIPVADLPDDTLLYLVGSSLRSGNRQAEPGLPGTISAMQLWRAGPRVQAICDFVNGHIAFGYESACSTRTAYEAYAERARRLPRFRPSGGGVLPLHEHPGALLATDISATSGCRRTRRLWISAPGSRRFWAANGDNCVRRARHNIAAASAAS